MAVTRKALQNETELFKRIQTGFNNEITKQRAELQRQIWQVANEVRSSVDGWDFKQNVLGTLTLKAQPIVIYLNWILKACLPI